MASIDYDDLDVDTRWCAERRGQVCKYLQQQPGEHGAVGEWPAWHLAPYVSVWAVESKSNPGSVGWWAICGDLPTDYVSAAVIMHPRDAMEVIASRWLVAAQQISAGTPTTDFVLGNPSNWATLGPLLESRARLLQTFAADKEIWNAL